MRHKLQQKLKHLTLGTLCKSVLIFVFIVVFLYSISSPSNKKFNDRSSFLPSTLKWKNPTSSNGIIPIEKTNINHIVFGIAGSMNTWKNKRAYIESWWVPNVTKGYIFIERPPEKEFLPWPSTSPPFRVNENVTSLKYFDKLASPNIVRIVRSVLETYRQRDKNVRWYVMTDDDTVVFPGNLVDVLSKYDHRKYHYIGASSEAVKINCDFSYDMAFGGAGFALSSSLVKVLSTTLDGCLERYPHIVFSDYLLYSCLADLGVTRIHERGFHQLDFHGDISGFLSAHLPVPVVTLHHFDMLDPLFPSKDRIDSIHHLMKAAKVDRTRLFQQTVCYHKRNMWSFSVSWGYTANIYESLIPRSILRKPRETFGPWFFDAGPYFYLFSWRKPGNDPCQEPHVFYFDSIKSNFKNHTALTVYTRHSPPNLPLCSLNEFHSANPVRRIEVLSPSDRPKESGSIDCCDVDYKKGKSVAEVRLRSCMEGEMLA